MECLESIKCKICSKVLEKPVLLPCGNVMCEKHQQGEMKSIYCKVCDLDHEIPPNGAFIRILLLDKLIENNLGDEYNSAKYKLERFSDLIEKFENLNDQPECIIHNKISELKAEIDWRRETLKNQIDEDALAFIKKLDDYGKECNANITASKSNINVSNEMFSNLGKLLKKLREQMDNLKMDVTLWNNIKEVTSIYDQMESIYNDIYNKFFLNRLNDHNNLKVLLGSDRDMIR